MKTKLALTFYYISIATLVLSALGIVWRFIIFPPCTQIGNNCVLQPWDISGFAGTILGISATMVGILGALAVAAWWTSLDKRVTEQVNELYKTQEKILAQKTEGGIEALRSILLPLDKKAQKSEENIKNINKSLDDFERVIAATFAAMGPSVSEPMVQRAIAKGRFLTLPLEIVKNNLIQDKQENIVLETTTQITRDQNSYKDIVLNIDFDANYANDHIRSHLENKKQELLEFLEYINNVSPVNANLNHLHHLRYWCRVAKAIIIDGVEDIDDFDAIEQEVNAICFPMEAIEQEFNELIKDVTSFLSRIESMLN